MVTQGWLGCNVWSADDTEEEERGVAGTHTCCNVEALLKSTDLSFPISFICCVLRQMQKTEQANLQRMQDLS